MWTRSGSAPALWRSAAASTTGRPVPAANLVRWRWALAVFSDGLEDIIDSVLSHACPDWTAPPRVDPAEDDADQRRYHRIEVTRLRLGRALAGQPDLTARLSARIFEAVLLEHSVSDQLTAPLITAVGRRAVPEQLTAAVSEGPCQRRANAAADPERFQEMLDRSTGYGYRI